jgi:CubicO group peptidase (beta-lactamase class C family)
MIDLQRILDSAVRAGQAPGLSAAVITPDGRRLTACSGVRGVDNPSPMTTDTLFAIASCTKAITSVAALQLVDRGLADLDTPVGRWLPALAAPRVLTGFDAGGAPLTRPAARPVTLRGLLTHTTGLAYDFCSAELTAWLAATDGSIMVGEPDIPLMFEPGERWQYGIGIDWAGRLIEVVTGKSLGSWCAETIFEPLGMTDSTFSPNDDQATRQASVHVRSEDGELAAIPLVMPPFMMGGGGLHATAGDYLTFLGALLAGGSPLLKPETFTQMMENHTGELDAGALKSVQPAMSRDFEPLAGLTRRHGLAGLLNMEPVPGGRSAGALAWAGIANCYYWADPKARAAGVLFAQVMPFADPDILATFEEIERAVYA